MKSAATPINVINFLTIVNTFIKIGLILEASSDVNFIASVSLNKISANVSAPSVISFTPNTLANEENTTFTISTKLPNTLEIDCPIFFKLVKKSINKTYVFKLEDVVFLDSLKKSIIITAYMQTNFV
jgi:hypothetical protein